MFELIVLKSSVGEFTSVLCDDLFEGARQYATFGEEYEFVTIQQKSECRSCEAITDGKAQWCNSCVQKLHDSLAIQEVK